MPAYFVLSNLSQPSEIPGLNGMVPNPKYGQDGDIAYVGDVVTDEPGGFLEHRTDPRTGVLKESYYTMALNGGWLVRLNEAPDVVDMLHLPDVLRAAYDAASAAAQAEKPKKSSKKSEEPAAAPEPEPAAEED